MDVLQCTPPVGGAAAPQIPPSRPASGLRDYLIYIGIHIYIYIYWRLGGASTVSTPRNREIVSYSSSFLFRVVRDVRVVRAGEAKLCEGVRETIFLSLGLGTASCPPVVRPFWTNFCRQAWGF